MSKIVQGKRISIPDIRSRKGREPIVSLTAYTASVSRAIAPHVDFMLVGDSLGMVIYGLDSTVGVTMEMMLAHGAAVRRGAPDVCVVVDMPFASYEESPQIAFKNAARLMSDTRCDTIKLEGGVHMAPTIRYLVQRGIPVLAHVGLTPQSVNVFGGFKAQGRDAEAAAQILQDARAVEEAGAFAVVVEGVIEALGKQNTETVTIPTIGIGASPSCDGQILVTEDILGLFDDFKPKFVKRYAHMAKDISAAAEAYAADVRSGRFPTMDHCFGVKKGKVVAL